MRKRKMFPFLAAGIVALASCNTPQKEVVKIAAINPANMDTTVAAGTDFYEKNRHKAQRKAKFYINKCRSASCMQSGWKRTPA